MLNLTRRMVALRHDHPVLRTGNMRMQPAGSVLQFQRGEGADALLCVFNIGHGAEAWTAPDGWRVIESVNASELDGTLPTLAGLLLARSSG